MTYSEAIQFLFDQLPMFQRTGPSAYKDNLNNTMYLDAYFKHPHQHFRTIHVAGTNGKGSVSHMIASILQEAGYRTGLYTSPHLRDFRERIKINGEMISEEEVTNFVENHKHVIEKVSPSFFEMTVAMAFNYFSQQQVDVAVIEVGLGGRLDSTNIIRPEISVITNIGMDHMALLGNTLQLIAREKAGIIKMGIPAVIGQYQEEVAGIFQQIANDCKASLTFADSDYFCRTVRRLEQFQEIDIYRNDKVFLRQVRLSLLGKYQTKNVQTVCSAIDQLILKGFEISQENIRKGLCHVVKNTGLMGRWQILQTNPLIICDTGHNEDGIKEVVTQILETPFDNLHMVVGMVNDKAIDAILKLLPKQATYYFTRADIPRSLDANILKSEAKKFGLYGEAYVTVLDAVNEAKKNARINDLIFIGGSTFVVAEAI